MADHVVQYYTASDCRVFVNDIWLDEAFSVGYTLDDPKVPIYGYADTEYKAVAQGKRIVQGELIMNYRNQNALSLALMQSGGDATMDKLRQEMNVIQGVPASPLWDDMKRSINGAVSGLPSLDTRIGTALTNLTTVVYRYCYASDASLGVLGAREYSLVRNPGVYAEAIDVLRSYGITDAEIKSLVVLIVNSYDENWNAALSVGTTEWSSSPNNSPDTIEILQLKNDIAVRYGRSELKTRDGILFDLGVAQEFKSKYWKSPTEQEDRYRGLPNPASISMSRPATIDIYLGELPEISLQSDTEAQRRSGYRISLIGCIFTNEQFIMAQGMDDHAKISYSFFAKRVTP